MRRSSDVRSDFNLVLYIGNDIAVPHVRLEGLSHPEMILGLSRAGMRLNGNVVKILLFFATPAEQTEEHLQPPPRLCLGVFRMTL